MSDDFFSDGGLDLSDEALDARTEEEELVEESVDVDDSADDVVESDDSDGDAAEVVEPVVDEFVEPEKIRGKSREELAKIYAETESFLSKQVAEAKAEAERVRQELEAQKAPDVEEELGAYYDENDVANALADYDPIPAYQAALGLLEAGTTGPDSVARIIKDVRQYDPDLAAEMDRDFTIRLADANARAKYEQELHAMREQVRPVQETYARDTLARVAVEVTNSDEDFQVYAKEIAAIMQHNPQVAASGNEAQIRAALSQALTMARGADPARSVHVQRQLIQGEKKNSQVLGGAGKAPASKSEDDLIRDSVFTPNDPVADWFK